MSLSKHAILMLHAAAMTAFLALTYAPGPSSASPAPLLLPRITADYLPNVLTGTDHRAAQLGHNAVGDDNRVDELDPRRRSLSLLTEPCTRAKDQATNFHTYLLNHSGDGDFHNTCDAKTRELKSNLVLLLNEVHATPIEKGAAYYDDSSELRTLLKDLINEVKDVLALLDNLIEEDPLLGLLLGKLVYDTKCILDDILNGLGALTNFLLTTLLGL